MSASPIVWRSTPMFRFGGPGSIPIACMASAAITITRAAASIVHIGWSGKNAFMREAFEWSAKVEAPGEPTWYKGPKAYWTDRFAKDDDGVSVAEEDRDPKSLLNHYRALLKLRAAHPALRSGTQRVVPGGNAILAVERGSAREKLLVVANLSGRPAEYLVTGTDLLTGRPVLGLHLKPYQASVIRT